MRLRRLELKDAPFMLEWMHDDNVIHDMQAKFKEKTLNDCEQFIIESLHYEKNLHLAITDNNDIYMGTVSLKNIDISNSSAEFAITVRKSAMGKGYSQYAVNEIIKIAFNKIKLKQVYWCVGENNKRAIRFYEKIGAIKLKKADENMLKAYSNVNNIKLNWYCINKTTNY